MREQPKLTRAQVERISRSFFNGQVVAGKLDLMDMERLAADCLGYMDVLEMIRDHPEVGNIVPYLKGLARAWAPTREATDAT